MQRAEAAIHLAVYDHVKRGQIEIDQDGEVQPVSDGMWVQAWVFVAAKDIDAILAEEVAQ